MKLSLFDVMCKKRLQRRYLIFFAAIVVFHSLIYYPINIFLNADFLLSESLLSFFWSELLGPLVNYLSFWGTFAFFLYSVVRFSFRDSVRILLIYAAGTAMGYLLQNALFVLIMGLNTWSAYFHPLDLLFSLFVDYLIVGGATGLAYWWSRRARQPKLRQTESNDVLFVEGFPLDRFMNLKNPLLKTAFLSAILPSAIRILFRLWYDFDLIVLKGIPIFDVGELLLILTYYAVEAISIFVGYLVIFMLLSAFYLSDVKAKLKSESDF